VVHSAAENFVQRKSQTTHLTPTGVLMEGLYAQNPSMIEIAVAVEELLRAKLLKTKLRRDALEATLSVFERSPNPPNFGCLARKWTLSTATPVNNIYNASSKMGMPRGLELKYNASHDAQALPLGCDSHSCCGIGVCAGD
jgi:hypothetical protein